MTKNLTVIKHEKLYGAESIGSILLAIILRCLMIPFTNYDTDGYIRWYDYIATHGISNALGTNFAIYTPPYLYLLSLATLAEQFIPALVAIKVIPILFDLINAGIIYKILRLKYPAGYAPTFAMSIFLLAPTVMLNSAFWGQIDSLYTCLLLLATYCILTERPISAMLAFGISISIKAQAIFLAPFLLLMAFKKKIPWYAFGLIPLTYLAMMLPAIFAGRSVADVTTIYLTQANTMQIPSVNSPNWYIFVPQSAYSVSTRIGFGVAILVLGIWVTIYSRRNFALHAETLLVAALASVALTPLLLPKMHDRYFYPADVLSLALALYVPRVWFVPLAYQIISLLAYSIFLFGVSPQEPLVFATVLNTALIAHILWMQHRTFTLAK